AVAVATLVSLAHGWDYRLAVQTGCAITILLAWLCWLELSPERIADRAAALLAGTLAGTLLCIYVLAMFPFGLPMHGAFVGLTLGLVMFALIPVRYVLDRAHAFPNARGLMLFAVAVAPLTLGVLELGLNDSTNAYVSRDIPAALPFCRATILIAAVGF